MNEFHSNWSPKKRGGVKPNSGNQDIGGDGGFQLCYRILAIEVRNALVFQAQSGAEGLLGQVSGVPSIFDWRLGCSNNSFRAIIKI
jgi:hypothetical protein